MRVFKALAVFTTVTFDLHHGPDNAAVRIRQQHPVTQFTDLLRGIIHADEKLAREDFIIHRRDGLFAYNGGGGG